MSGVFLQGKAAAAGPRSLDFQEPIAWVETGPHTSLWIATPRGEVHLVERAPGELLRSAKLHCGPGVMWVGQIARSHVVLFDAAQVYFISIQARGIVWSSPPPSLAANADPEFQTRLISVAVSGDQVFALQSDGRLLHVGAPDAPRMKCVAQIVHPQAARLFGIARTPAAPSSGVWILHGASGRPRVERWTHAAGHLEQITTLTGPPLHAAPDAAGRLRIVTRTTLYALDAERVHDQPLPPDAQPRAARIASNDSGVYALLEDGRTLLEWSGDPAQRPAIIPTALGEALAHCQALTIEAGTPLALTADESFRFFRSTAGGLEVRRGPRGEYEAAAARRRGFSVDGHTLTVFDHPS